MCRGSCAAAPRGLPPHHQRSLLVSRHKPAREAISPSLTVVNTRTGATRIVPSLRSLSYASAT
eukprot:3681478-Prymnesium_polylepis.1